MGVGKSKTEKDLILRKSEKELLCRLWPIMLRYQPNLFIRLWTSTIRHSVSVRAIFSLQLHDDPRNSVGFMRLARTVESFFNRMIVSYKLDQDCIEQECFELGAQHLRYSPWGFTPAEWEIFRACMIEGLEDLEFGIECDERRHLIVAWRRLIDVVIKHMKKGYEGEKELRESSNRKASTV